MLGTSASMAVLTGKKNAQRESCELSFIGGKMKTIAREMASQRALRNCSKEVVGRSVYM